MEELLNSVNAEGAEVVTPQAEQVDTPVESVNAESAETTPAEQEGKQAQSPEQNAAFAKVRREAEAKAKAQARDEMIAEMYGESHGIRTYAEYQAAVQRQKEAEALQEMVEKSIPEEYAKEILESRKFREEYQTERQKMAEQERQKAEFDTFLSLYPDVKPDAIPQGVWDEFSGGKSLVDAYARHENSLLKSQIAELQKAVGIREKNAENAATGTGSLTGQGDVPAGYFTEEQVDNMTQAEVNKHYKKVIDSMQYWKKK